MNIDKHETIHALRSAIREQVSLSRAKRAEIDRLRTEGPSTGPARCALWREKRAIGSDTRDMLLALGFVRGRAYARIEPHTQDAPYAGNVLDGLFVHARHPAGATEGEIEAFREDAERGVVAWLKGEGAAEPAAQAA